MKVRTLVLVAAVSVVCSACAAETSDSPSSDDRSLTLTEYVETIEAMEPPERSIEDSDLEDVMRERLRWDDSSPFPSLPASASEACTGALAFLDRRESGAQESGAPLWNREREAEKLIAELSTRPDFVAASTSHQEAIVEGIRAAAAGNC